MTAKIIKLVAFIHIICLLFAVTLFAIPVTREYAQMFFFASGDDFLADFLNNVSSLTLAQGFNPYHHWLITQLEQTYPPFSYALFMPFTLLMPAAGMSLSACHASTQAMMVGAFGVGLMLIVFFVSLIILCKRYALPLWTSCILFISGQAIACYERGNMILIAIAGIIIFLCYFQDERSWVKVLAAFGLAVAVALKVTPILFGVIWLNKKDFRWLVLAGVFTLLLTFVPLLWSDYTIIENVRQLMVNATENEKFYADCSLAINPSCIMRMFFRQALGLDISIAPASIVILIVKIGCAIVGILGLIFASLRKMPLWQCFFLISASQVMLSPAPQSYVLLYFIPSFVALLSTMGSDSTCNSSLCCSKMDSVVLQRMALVVFFLIIMLPFPLFVYKGININFAFQSIAVLFFTVVLELNYLIIGVNWKALGGALRTGANKKCKVKY